MIYIFQNFNLNNRLKEESGGYKNIKDDVILYKKEMKSKMNKLFNRYLDISDNSIIENMNFKTEKI